MNKYLAFLFVSSAAAAGSSKNLRSQFERDMQVLIPNPCDGGLLLEPCTSTIVEFFDTGSYNSSLFCETPGGLLLEVPCVDEAWVDEQRELGNLNGGLTTLTFPEGVTINEQCEITCTVPPDLENPPILTPNICVDGAVSGIRDILVVRVESADGLPQPNSEADYSDSIFGTSGDAVNLKSQTAACSHNNLWLEPFDGTANGGTVPTPGGVITVTVPAGTTVNSLNYQNAVTQQLEAIFGKPASDIANHVMYCMPEGVMNAVAYGFINSFVSVHQPEWCLRLSTPMHEIFHNLGLGHAGDETVEYFDKEYDDMTGYMGYVYHDDDHPQMCFNAANTHQLGWFCDKTANCIPTPCNSCEYEVGSFVDYPDPNVENVLMRIPPAAPGGDFYYLTFNAQKNFNTGMIEVDDGTGTGNTMMITILEGPNKVIVNRQGKEGLFGDKTYLDAILDVGDSFTIQDAGVPGGQKIITVTGIVNDIATITVTVPSRCEVDPGSKGDPHFKTWKNEHFEYHGQCDMILAQDEKFANGLGIDIHIRTKLVRYWSYIKNAAIRIGTDVLEVEGLMDSTTQTNYWINYEFNGELDTIGGFPIKRTDVPSRIFEIDLDSVYPGQKILIGHFKEFVSVQFEHPSDASFGNTVGLLGDFKTGNTLARDGVTVLHDFSELGNEWQVKPSDARLFRAPEQPQFPNLCLEPEDPRGDRQRKLSESSVLEEEAEKACAGLKDPMDRKDCVYDILATQDLTMAGAY